MFFKYTHMLTVLVMQMKFSELLEYSSKAGRMEASYTVMWLIFQVLITLPICVSQLLIGQYGKRLQIRTWELSPIIFGIGFSMLLMSLLYMTMESQLSIMAIEYTFASFSKPLPWCSCEFQGAGEGTCIDIPGKLLFFERALDENEDFGGISNRTFYSHSERRNFEDILRKRWQLRVEGNKISPYHYFKMREEDMRHIYIWMRIVIIILFWGAVFAAGIMRYSLYVKIAPCALVIFAALVITGYVVIFLKYNISWAIDNVSMMQVKYFIEIKAWMHAAFTVTKSLIAGTGCMIFFGYFLVGNARPDLNAALLSLLKISMCLIMCIFFVNIFQYEESRYGISDMNDRETIAGDSQLMYTVPLLLAFLCNLPASNICSIICFILLAIFQYMVVVLEMSIVITCIYESFKKIQRYRLYLLGGVCFLMLIIEFVKLVHDGIEVLEMLHLVKKETTNIIVMVYTFFVHILYGPNKLANDMELMIQSKMPPFWIGLWILSFVLSLITIPSMNESIEKKYTLNTAHGVIMILVILPIIIVAIILYFRYLKNHVLYNLIRPTKKWKPKDYDHDLFDVYDFRKKVRYKIHHKVCEHPCLDNAAQLDDEERAIIARREELLQEGGEGE